MPLQEKIMMEDKGNDIDSICKDNGSADENSSDEYNCLSYDEDSQVGHIHRYNIFHSLFRLKHFLYS